MTKQRKIAIFGGSFNPPGIHHRRVVQVLAKYFDEVIVVPCGLRPDKQNIGEILSIHKAAMVDMTFGGMPKVRVDLFDLENETFTRTFILEKKFKKDGDIWHVVGTDLVQGGARKNSQIQLEWANGRKIWNKLQFAVFNRPNFKCAEKDFPPNAIFFNSKEGSSTEIREKLFNHQHIDDLVTPEVANYIERYGLYRGMIPRKVTSLCLDDPRPLVVYDKFNSKSKRLAGKLRGVSEKANPNLIVVLGGDGVMLHAIRTHWRKRLPFFGINTGHLGFLLNDVAPKVSRKLLKSELILRQSPLLYIEALCSNGIKHNAIACNDAWVQTDRLKTAWLEVKIDGKARIPKLVGDGVLVATSAGSTAYSRSMGATPILIGTEALILAGSNVSDPMGWRSAHISLDSVVEIRSLDPTPVPKKRPIYGCADDIDFGEIDKMKIRVSKIAATELAFLKETDLAEKLASVQFPSRSG